MDDLVNQIKVQEGQIATNQQLWQAETMPRIQKILKDIKISSELNMHVQVNGHITNHESIYLAFDHKPSGMHYEPDDLYNKQEGLSGLIMQNPAALFYSIDYLGNVTVWYQYPEIKNIVERTPPNYFLIRYVTQAEITEDSIEEDVEIFFAKILQDWYRPDEPLESPPERPPIGFQITE